LMKDWKEQNNGLPASSKTVSERFSAGDILVIMLVLISTILVSLAQVSFKMAWSNSSDPFSHFSKMLLLGLALCTVGAFFFMTALRRKNVTFVIPFMTLSYVWVTFLSAYLFGEIITLTKLMAISLIFTGIFLIFVGGKVRSKMERTTA